LNRCVLDASVALKWYIPEVHSDLAMQVLDSHQAGDLALHVPDLFLAEAGNILWKKVRRGEISERNMEEISRSLLCVPKTVYATALLLPAALKLARVLDTTVYDSLYLALAGLLDCPLITADQRLWRSVSRSRWSPYIRWIGEI
jgi:predicted nucleic acid-binding protein